MKQSLRHAEPVDAVAVAGHNRLGVLCMLAAMVNVVANTALVKLAGQSVPAFQLAFVQGALMTLFLLAAVLALRLPLRRDFVLSGPVLLRSAFDAIALVVFFIALP